MRARARACVCKYTHICIQQKQMLRMNECTIEITNVVGHQRRRRSGGGGGGSNSSSSSRVKKKPKLASLRWVCSSVGCQFRGSTSMPTSRTGVAECCTLHVQVDTHVHTCTRAHTNSTYFVDEYLPNPILYSRAVFSWCSAPREVSDSNGRHQNGSHVRINVGGNGLLMSE